jgi:hypothetical protein
MTQVSLPQTQPSRHAGLSTRSLLALSIASLGVIAIAAGFRSGLIVTPGPIESASLSQSLDGATSANVHLQFGAGELTVDALSPAERSGARVNGGAVTLATMSSTGPANFRPASSYGVRAGVGELAYTTGDSSRARLSLPFIGRDRDHTEMHVQLAPGVPLSLDVQAGAADSVMDLSALRISRLDLQTGASNTQVRLPQAAGQTQVTVTGGIANLTFDIPNGVAADIRLSAPLSGGNVDETRFRPLGHGRYRSADYDTAANRVDLQAEVGIANITVR